MLHCGTVEWTIKVLSSHETLKITRLVSQKLESYGTCSCSFICWSTSARDSEGIFSIL